MWHDRVMEAPASAMTEPELPTVHLLCGLNGAGKTTYAKRLARHITAVRFTLDEWMLRLYSRRYDEPEYATQAEVCKALI